MKVNRGNIFAEIPAELPEELFEEILRTDSFALERIISKGHATPQGEWDEQERNEWVIVLAGRARLRFESGEALELGPGDHLLLPARLRHRVEWTDPERETVWLALHF